MNGEWFVFPKSSSKSKLRLFCFPYAGGTASLFSSWPSYLPSQVEVCAIQLPGREGRLKERPFNKLQPLVQELLEVLPDYLDLPFALMGHSMGAAIAFELARQLRQKHKLVPLRLFASARMAPQLPPQHQPIYALPDAAFVQRVREFNGTPEAILQDQNLMKWFMPLLRADFEVNETYRYSPEPPLACPISAFRGAKDKIVSYEQMAAWREQTSNSFTLRTIPGDHFFIQNSRDLFLQVLGYDLRQLLDRQVNRETFPWRSPTQSPTLGQGPKGDLYDERSFNCT